MAFNGSGTFVINTAGQPVVPNTVISATAFNALTADLANGLSTCITKDGQTTPTANIPMGNNKITGLAPGTSGTDAANLSQVQGSTAKLLQSVTGTDTITAAMVPALTSYVAGQMFYFVAAGDNTGAVTINIDSLGAKSVTRDGSTALVAGDITNGKVVVIVYDGTRFQLLNSNAFTNLYVSGNLGVGTASPGYRLQVNQAIDTYAFCIRDTIGNDRILIGSRSTAPIDNIVPVQMGNDNAGNLFLSSRTNLASGINFYTNAGTAAALRATLDSSGNLGIGTASPSARLHVAGESRFGLGAEAVRAAIGSAFAAGQGELFTTSTNSMGVGTAGAANLNFYSNSVLRMIIDSNGNVRTNTGALTTTATDGFLYVPTCAGTPTGVPTAITGMAPIVVNTTNNKLYFYSGGAWRDAGP